MCGRVIQSSPVSLAIVDGLDVRDSRVHNYPPRWNGAPAKNYWSSVATLDTGQVSLDPLRWGLILLVQDPKGGRKPINAKCETVHDLPTFRDAYRRRRCIVPVDGFFEWKAIKGQKAKQPYAIAMKDGARSASVESGKIGGTRLQASGFGRLRSSRPTPTSLLLTFTTGCRSSFRQPITPAGSATKPTRAT